ncbi:MAG: ecdysteroid 22-kinase family protein [Chloroflexi bacterium]|nr:ecdysteroid 22-kinase family protein [Chloroflexota bacterium]MCI0575829.1 ecdysteroid 22-kinase family protein [Chloroflexota bacterium]MCI0646556.1 ecdysteroid 22-kinase family protein [Chloroflexota bacterium]MCI0726358.1 ecdysteroid 22-kinase family protein [Chloroflexota bacterium]
MDWRLEIRDWRLEAETAGPCHVLMDDLSESHFQRPLPIPPSNHHCTLIVESLAQLHAR